MDRAAGEGIKVINQVADEGSDLRQFHRVLLECLRGILLLKSGAKTTLGYPEETLDLMNAMAKRSTIDHVVRTLKTFSAVELRRDSSSPLPLELAMVRVDAGAKSAGSRSRARGSSTRAANERRARLRSTGPVGSLRRRGLRLLAPRPSRRERREKPRLLPGVPPAHGREQVQQRQKDPCRPTRRAVSTPSGTTS